MIDMAKANQSTDDAELWADWVRTHHRLVRGYLLAMLRRTDLADDLAQDVFLKAWQARDNYREQGHARAYLLRIADRLVFDRARKRREVDVCVEQWHKIEPACSLEGPPESLLQGEVRGQLAAALENLTPPQRRVLLLRYYGDLSFAQIAEIMECPLSTALSHGHRGLQALRTQLVESEL